MFIISELLCLLYMLLDFMISVMQRMHWMQWMVDFWMEGSSVSRWLDMEDHHLHIVVIAVGGGGYIQTVLPLIIIIIHKRFLSFGLVY